MNCRDIKFRKTVWKSLAFPIVNYCSPLRFSPVKPGDISGLEDLQGLFFGQVSGLEEFSHWDRLKEMKMHSIQKCIERYIVIYIWEITEGKVPNCCIGWTYNERRGCLCSIPPLTKSSRKIQSLWDNSLQVIGSKLFNEMLKELRNISGCRKEVLKSKLFFS